MVVADAYSRWRRQASEEPLSFLFQAVVVLGGILLLADLVRRLGVGGLTFAQLLTYLIDGLTVGLVVGLAGVGLSMTYSILSFANFSHGDYLTSGAFMGWSVTYIIAGFGSANLGTLFLVGGGGSVSGSGLGIAVLSTPVAILAGLVVAAVGTVLLALLLDRIVYRPMREQGSIALLIASIGVALALRYLIVFVYQTGTRGITDLNNVSSVTIPIVDGTITLDIHEVTLTVAAVALMLGVHLLLQRTKLGKAMRAMADNKSLARVTGIPTERIVRATWIIGGGLAGAAGYLVALEKGTLSYNLGWILLLLIFAAVILGGIGSIYGAIGGGLIIGVADTVSIIWLPSGFTKVAAFAVMILVLLFRPSGIFGGVTTA